MQYQKSIKFLQGRKEEISTGAETSIIPWRISILWPSNQSHSIYTKDKSTHAYIVGVQPYALCLWHWLCFKVVKCKLNQEMNDKCLTRQEFCGIGLFTLWWDMTKISSYIFYNDEIWCLWYEIYSVPLT